MSHTSAQRSTPSATEKLHQQLEQQSRIFDTTLSSITDFVYIFDKQGRFAYANQALLDLWGLKLEDAVGTDFYDLKYPHELAGRLQRQIRQVFDTKEGLTDETPYTSPTGAGGYYEYIFRPVFDAQGAVVMVAGSTRDITERKRVAEELKESQEKLRLLAESLENQVRVRTDELERRNNDVLTQSDRLRELSVRLMETQDVERRRIARDLHDSAGQLLAVLLINLARVSREIQDISPSLSQLVEETRMCGDELNREIRTTSYLLHPPMLDELGLRAALEWYVEGLNQRSGLAVDLSFEAGRERPSHEMELAVFRVVQECLTNIHRHSGSKTAHIRILWQDANLVVEIRDAGRGIAPEALRQIQSMGTGVGLRGIRERIRPFSGRVNIESQEGVGTTVYVTLPLGERSQP